MLLATQPSQYPKANTRRRHLGVGDQRTKFQKAEGKEQPDYQLAAWLGHLARDPGQATQKERISSQILSTKDITYSFLFVRWLAVSLVCLELDDSLSLRGCLH